MAGVSLSSYVMGRIDNGGWVRQCNGATSADNIANGYSMTVQPVQASTEQQRVAFLKWNCVSMRLTQDK